MPPSIYEFGRFSLDPAEQRLSHEGVPVPLTPRVFDLLLLLVVNAGHLVEKDRLLTEVWKDAIVEEANLTRAISVLRRALGETADKRFIETVPKRGYRFVIPVTQSNNDETVSAARPGKRFYGWAVATGVAALLVISALFFARTDRASQSIAPVHRQLTFTGGALRPALSPDGLRVAYVLDEKPNQKLIVQHLSGGAAVEVFNAPEVGWLRWSPDGVDLIFRARGADIDGLYLVRPPGAARRIAAAGSFLACWSSDGSTIAIATFVRPTVTFVNRVGEVQRRIPLHGTRDWIWDIDWSSVHGRLLFVADDDRRRATIWTIHPDGTGQAKLFTASSEIMGARWARDGEAVYYSVRVNKTVSIYKIAVDLERNTVVGEPVTLLSGLETDGRFALSSDATRLVYGRAPYHSNLWLTEVVDSHGNRHVRQRQLTRGTSVIERPQVSPDGESILFTMGYESRANLFKIPAAGGAPQQLTFFSALSVGGVWSPDGRTIAFVSNEGDRPGIWLASADGSSPRLVTAVELSESYELLWRPGRRLLYHQPGNQNYSLLDLDTGRQEPLVWDSSVGWLSNATVSPDGASIAVSWNRAPSRGIWTIDTSSRSATLLLAGRFNVPIGWSRDGTAIFVVDAKPGTARGVLVPLEMTSTDVTVLRVPVNGGPPEMIASLPFKEVGTVAAFPDGRRFVSTVYSSSSDVWAVEHFDPTIEGTSLSRMTHRVSAWRAVR